MFRNTRGSMGLGALVAVAIVIAGYLTTAGFMWKAYAEGSDTVAAADVRCDVLCASRGSAKGNQG